MYGNRAAASSRVRVHGVEGAVPRGYRCGFLLYTGASLRDADWSRVDERRLDIVPRCLQAIYCHGPSGGLDAYTIIYGGGYMMVLEGVECSVSEKPLRRLLSSLEPVGFVGYRELLEAASAAGYRPVLLLERGEPWPPPPGRRLYIIGTSIDPPVTGLEHVASLGPRSYLASQVAAYIALWERGVLRGDEG